MIKQISAILLLSASLVGAVHASYAERLEAFTEVAQPVAQELNADLVLLTRMAKVESNFKPNAKASTSSAGGYFQFTNSTWRSMVKRYGEEVGVSPTTSKYDPVANTKMAVKLIQENRKIFQRVMKRSPSYGELYLAHFAGIRTAIAVVLSKPHYPSSSVFSPAQIKANKSILEGKTVGQVLAWAERKMM